MTAKELAKIYKALSNDNRLAIFLCILEYEKQSIEPKTSACVSDLLITLHIGAPTISHHLKELSNAGLITTEKSGKYLMAQVNQSILKELKQVFD